MKRAHPQPTLPGAWHDSSANPQRSYTLLNKEAPEYIRFVNPSDYRVAREACGACHLEIIEATERSLMSTAAMFWAGGGSNNGVVPFKASVFGEAYTRPEIGRAHVRTPLTNAPLVCRLLPEPKTQQSIHTLTHNSDK